MAVMRVEKTTNYTVMANYHLRDSRLSLRQKASCPSCFPCLPNGISP